MVVLLTSSEKSSVLNVCNSLLLMNLTKEQLKTASYLLQHSVQWNCECC